MDYDILEQQVAAARQRFDAARSRANKTTEHSELLFEVLEDLSNSLEELLVTAETLRQQREQLVAVRARETQAAARYQDLFDNAPDSYVLTDLNGIIAEANLAACQLLRVPRDFLIGAPLPAFVNQKDQSLFRSWVAHLGTGERRREWEMRLRLRSSAPRYVHVTVAAARDDTGRPTGLRWILRDVTDRKRTEQFTAFMDNLPGFAWMKDTAGRYVYVNEPFRVQLIGNRNDWRGKTDHELWPPAFAAEFRANDEKVITSRSTLQTVENYIQGEMLRHGLVSKFPILDDRGDVILVGGIAVDITDRKLAEDRLSEKEAVFRKIFEDTAMGVSLVGLDGRPVAVNRASQEQLGYTEEELRRVVFTDYTHPDEREADWNQFQELAQGKRDSYRVEKRFIHKTGKVVWGTVTVSLVRSPRGEPHFAIAMIEDITERRHADEELKELNQRLVEALKELEATQQQMIQQERLRALGEMAAGVAHDLNNALSPVLAYGEMLEADPKLPKRLRGPLGLIMTSARDIATVVDRLQSFVRPALGTELTDRVDLRHLVEQIPQLTRPKWHDEALRTGRVIEFRLQVSDVPLTRGNPVELREVLTNLVFNAVDAMPSGGQITLRLDNADQVVLLELADTGTGMPEDVRARCFEPFFTTKGPRGSGLGLSVCHGIIKRHGGQIEIHSELGCGTAFRIYLPLVSDVDMPTDTVPGLELRRYHVLYIDDDARVRPVLAKMLQWLGQVVDVADGGAAGLEMLRSHRYDVVITDMSMPQVDGAEVTRSIKQMRLDIPVILLTGWASPIAMESLTEEERPHFVLRKPPTMGKLAAALASVPRPPQ